MYVSEALSQSCHLSVEYLIAVSIEHVALWYEGQTRVAASECCLLFGDGGCVYVCSLGVEVGLCGGESGVATTLHAQLVEVYL